MESHPEGANKAALATATWTEDKYVSMRRCACSDPVAAGAPPHADILVFGPSGSGKSSLIRTFWMALHRSQQVPADFADRIIVKDTAMNEGTLKYVSAVVKPGKAGSGGQGSSAIVCHDTRGH